jgi:hypothetical protein
MKSRGSYFEGLEGLKSLRLNASYFNLFHCCTVHSCLKINIFFYFESIRKYSDLYVNLYVKLPFNSFYDVTRRTERDFVYGKEK